MKEIVIKRVLSLFLAFLMVFSVVPLTSYAYTDGSGGSPVNGGGNSSIGGNGGGIREPRFPDTYEFIKS